ncbi:phosphoglucosamine mutase [Pseudohongiella acticola]|uniref:Phosphoglucosamine mutase n=1 Tax=Pseudohongiella acticola TaxID=1524254 RepID=A0A1E8CMK0_9GAMM|nr:phosphoglucosamine mutase [Pseudohongiella acticola]OFE13659.1 phosphoglucosamine mutase [Pseudohongiella acticola]
MGSNTGKEKQYFGTDGIRGHVGEYPITPDFMLKLGWAAGKVFARSGGLRSKILIGKDTRVSGYMFEAALEAGLASAGVDINMLGPMPTPAVAYLTRTFRAQAGIVISASHNAFQDNGIKFFAGDGTKLPDATELAIEAYLDNDLTTVASDQIGKVTRITDAAGRYIEYCKRTLPGNAVLQGLNIVVDCAHGSTYHIAANVFAELGASVKAIGVSPNGMNINQDCGSTAPERLVQEVLAQQADIGIAFDGDGDRVVMVDHLGNVVDGDELLYIIARDRRRRHVDFGGVVGTLMSNLGLELGLKALDVAFIRTDVGDRYVMEMLKKMNWQLGGESSGHVVCLDVTTTGDGIVCALQVLAAMTQTGASLHDLSRQMTKMPQHMVNVRVVSKSEVMSNPVVLAAVAEVERKLAGRGRVLLRPSGTEPLIRVMVEGDDEAVVIAHAEALADVVTESITS